MKLRTRKAESSKSINSVQQGARMSLKQSMLKIGHFSKGRKPPWAQRGDWAPIAWCWLPEEALAELSSVFWLTGSARVQENMWDRRPPRTRLNPRNR